MTLSTVLTVLLTRQEELAAGVGRVQSPEDWKRVIREVTNWLEFPFVCDVVHPKTLNRKWRERHESIFSVVTSDEKADLAEEIRRFRFLISELPM